MKFGGSLFLERSEIIDLEALSEHLSMPNPEYTEAVKRKAWNKDSLPKELSYIYISPDGNTFAVPRNISPTLYRAKKEVDVTSEVFVPTMKFTKNLRDYQTEFFATTEADEYEDVIYEVSCGLGKTVMALHTIAKRKQRTVIIVPTNKLMGQWYREACFFLEGCTIGMSDKKVETSHTQFDILILSQDLARERGLGEEFFSTFGMSVWDELHRTGAQSYLPLLDVCTTRHRLGLTATFRRNDGHTRVLLWHFGSIFTMRYSGDKADIYALDLRHLRYTSAFKGTLKESDRKAILPYSKILESPTYYGFENTKKVAFAPITFAEKAMKFLSHPTYSSLESLSTTLPNRNRIVAHLIQKLLDDGRNVLVLSKRKDILKHYHKQFKDKVPTYLVISETTKDFTELVMQQDARLILGITQIAEYGFNVPRLDTLVLLHPLSDTEQAIGRILRKDKNKKTPLGIIVSDNNIYLRSIIKKAADTFIPFNGSFKGFFKLSTLCQKILTTRTKE